MNGPKSYPVFLNMSDRNCLVIGGGKVAARKINDLIAAGAKVTVVSPEFCDKIASLSPKVSLVKRKYRLGDEKGAFMVFACADDNKVNKEVVKNSKAAGALVNAVDSPEDCDFFVAAKVVRESFILALSTSGKAPAIAKKLRKKLEEQFGPEYGIWVELIGNCRKKLILESELDNKTKKEMLDKILDLPLIEWIKAGDMEKAKREIGKCISQ